MNPPKDDPVAFRFFNEIGIIEHLSRTEFERVLPDGLSLSGFGVLNHFVRLNKAGEAPARLARAFQVTKGAMTFTLQRLEGLGAITMAPDPADARAKIVAITDHGRALRDESLSRLAPLIGELMQEIDITQLEAALPILMQVRQYLDRRRD
jgi:DNA-binding MarR family transcriptional regulator